MTTKVADPAYVAFPRTIAIFWIESGHNSYLHERHMFLATYGRTRHLAQQGTVPVFLGRYTSEEEGTATG